MTPEGGCMRERVSTDENSGVFRRGNLLPIVDSREGKDCSRCGRQASIRLQRGGTGCQENTY